MSRLITHKQAGEFQPRSHLGMLLVKHWDRILALAHEHRVFNVRVFGSVARGEANASSDVDLLVDLAPGADLFDLARLDVELEKLLGHKVDIVPARMLRSHVAPRALAEAVAL